MTSGARRDPRPSGTRPAAVTVWAAVAAAHVWLAVLGVVVVPAEAFWDVDLYRWWAATVLAGHEGERPLLDQPWVYPAGALVPVLLAGLTTVVSTPGYALAWCALVTTLDVVAVAAVLRAGRRTGEDGERHARWAVLWWMGFLVALGPVALGRLDAVVVPLAVLALLAAGRRDARAAVLVTVAAWVKVAPGPLLLPVLAAARRPWRDVVLPAAAVCAVVAAAVTAAGAGPRLLSFLWTQGDRGLQAEAVAATPFVLAGALGGRSAVGLNADLITYEVTSAGAGAVAAALDLALPALVLAVTGVLAVARHRGTAAAAVVPAALTLTLVLVVANKVGSPQFVAWLAAPVVVAVASGTRDRWVPGLALAVAALTQVVFPWGYAAFVTGDVLVTGAVAARNAALLALTAVAVVRLLRVVRQPSSREATHAIA